GLAQLHQLRGRVGRGTFQSYCIFVGTQNAKQANMERLNILKDSNDGFKIAEEDLKLRGPGDFFGIRQSGDMRFELADIYKDADILKQASEAASDIMKDDPDLVREEHKNLKIWLDRWNDRGEVVL
ncbi:MAG: ATP-dependent DNA helicase RecG, partial [Lachnospira sp.]|nr:ATP-dependent DNA helicase RecG [Lachnospira sp.]